MAVQPKTLGVFSIAKPSAAAWHEKPTWYIVASNDRMIALGAGQVRIRVEACGIHHTDMAGSRYVCDITRAGGKLVAQVTSTLMTLRGEAPWGDDGGVMQKINGSAREKIQGE